MNVEIAIRRERADQADVVALLDALDAYLATLYAPEDNHILDVQALLAQDVRFFVARHDGQAVGCAAVRLMPAEAATGGLAYGEVKRMYVSPARRGQRLGVRLLHTLEATLRDEGLGQALLETGRDQHEALRLYQHCGYQPCAAFGGYPDNGLSVFLRKVL